MMMRLTHTDRLDNHLDQPIHCGEIDSPGSIRGLGRLARAFGAHAWAATDSQTTPPQPTHDDDSPIQISRVINISHFGAYDVGRRRSKAGGGDR